VNDAIVTVKVQGVGDPDGDAVVGELPHAPDTPIATAQHRTVIHVRRVRMP